MPRSSRMTRRMSLEFSFHQSQLHPCRTPGCQPLCPFVCSLGWDGLKISIFSDLQRLYWPLPRSAVTWSLSPEKAVVTHPGIHRGHVCTQPLPSSSLFILQVRGLVRSQQPLIFSFVVLASAARHFQERADGKDTRVR